jgi:NTP pyrophosphatase (non-canonical NTP hydrolase)
VRARGGDEAPGRWEGRSGESGQGEETIERGDDRMDIREIQQEVDRYISQFKEGYFPPLVNLARLTEEVGELARELNHRYGPKTKKPDEPEGDVAMELADVLFVLIVLANQMEIDLQGAVEKTMEKYRVRDADRWERKE